MKGKFQISCHGLGFLQIELTPTKRIHVWHPDVPHYEKLEDHICHNHRFDFTSTVLYGSLINQTYNYSWMCNSNAVCSTYYNYRLWSFPIDSRLHTGQRKAVDEGLVILREITSNKIISAGESYFANGLDFHQTKVVSQDNILITMIEKSNIRKEPAKSITKKTDKFEENFDRHQLSDDQYWEIFYDAINRGNKI